MSIEKDAAEMTLAEFEAKLRSLLEGEFASLIIDFNNSEAINYCGVAKFREEYGDDAADVKSYISPDEQAKAEADNSRWSLQWYPDTPIGFYRISASSLVALARSLSPKEQAP